MMVRRYVVKDMPEAVLQIRKDLGKDAVILSTKRITLKKYLGIWRSKRIEVLAAYGQDVPMRSSLPQFQNLGATPSAHEARQTSAPPTASVHASPSQVQQSMMLDDRLEEKQPSPVVSEGEGTSPPVNDVVSEASSELARLHQGIDEIKQLLQAALKQEDHVWHSTVRHLVQQGIDEENLRGLMDEEAESQISAGVTQPVPAPMDVARLHNMLGDRIQEQLQGLKVCQPIAPSSRVIAFVGPTGVGKTTTVAKVAALHVLGGQRRVGLITTDTFRIAAVEQLRTYAGILNVPLEVVYQPSELPLAIERLSDCDMILIDTAGRNFRVESCVRELHALLSSIEIDETYLVLSVTSKPSDLDRLAATFCELPVDKFVFTKLDETSTYGAILNLLFTYRKPISYVTTGQNVPDDIEVASLDKLLRMILEGAA